MKAGRNDPCPCGSGKKFKKCCIAKEQAVASSAPVSKPKGLLPPVPARPPAPPAAPAPSPPPPRPRSPAEERWDVRWQEFEDQKGAGRRDVFLRTLDDKELMTDEMAFEMLSLLYQDAVTAGERLQFAELVSALAERQPEVYQQSAHYYLSWRLQDALAAGSQDNLALVRELAPYAGEHIDTVNRSLQALAYHGQLAAIVETLRLAWPSVQAASDILAWAIAEFCENGASYEIYNYLEHTPAPDARDRALFERVQFFVPEPDLDLLAELLGDLAGQASPAWTLADFAFKPVPKKRRDDWDDADDGAEPPDPGANNLARLIAQFVGYLRRVEGVPYPRGELVRHELLRYFSRRHRGELAPRLSMLDQAMNPNKKLPPPPKPGHPLCPDRATLDVFLGGLLGFMNAMYHTAAALFEIVPAWLRFLEVRGLIDADRHAKTLEELRPLHVELLRLMETNHEDPAIYRALQSWPARPVAAPRDAP